MCYSTLRIDAPLIRDMGVDGHGAIVIAEVARTETAHQRIRVQGKALAIGRGRQAMPPDTTQFETVMIIHQDRIGRFEGVLAEAPRREILEHIYGDPNGTVAHGD